MSEQQLLSEKLATELEKVKQDCPEFSYALIGQTVKSSKKNAYKLMLNGKRIGEVWPRGNYGHLYTNILTEEEKSKVIKVSSASEYIPGPGNDTDYYNFHEKFILKWNREFKSLSSVSSEVKDLIRKSRGHSSLPIGSPISNPTSKNTPLSPKKVRLLQNVILKSRENTLAYLIAICDRMDLDKALAIPYEKHMDRYSQLKNMGRIASITFYPEYQYDDFMEKIIHITNSNDGIEKDSLKDGDFKRFCANAANLAYHIHDNADILPPCVFLINDMDNGNICEIFGEVMNLLPDIEKQSKEDDKDVILPYSGELFEIPKNVHIVGIMNSTNKLDYWTLETIKQKFQFV